MRCGLIRGPRRGAVSVGVNLLYLSSCDWDRFSGSVECIHGAVRMAGETSLEEPPDFACGLALSLHAFSVGAGSGIINNSDDRLKCRALLRRLSPPRLSRWRDHLPQDRGHARKRSKTLAAARARNPERFGMHSDPQILAAPPRRGSTSPPKPSTSNSSTSPSFWNLSK